MKVTTESIIKMLPFDGGFKKNLLDSWETLTSDQKLEMNFILWGAYTAVYEITFEKNMQEAFLRIGEGLEHADEDLYDRIKKKTDEEIQHLDDTGNTSADLSKTREELEKLLANTSH
jgi:hypothetical protein